MLSKQMIKSVESGSAIRRMFLEGEEMARRVGKENVCDFSLGNPVAPVPEIFRRALIDLTQREDMPELHAYMNNAGFSDVRKAIAENLNRRYGTDLDERHIIMTVGAAGALNVVLKAILDPGDEVIFLRPYFGEYRSYVANWHGVGVEVDYVLPSFEPDLDDLKRKITSKTKAVLVNNPVNPSGVVYDEALIRAFTDILKEKEKEYGHEIYLVSDEPYRELVYDGAVVEYLPDFYDNTLVAYSFSKSMSIPGERIGYLIVPPRIAEWELTVEAMTVANRVCGYVNAPSLLQKAVAMSLEAPCDVEFYDRNRKKLYDGLTALNYSCVPPRGAFYLLLKSPVPDEQDFIESAKAHNMILVAGSAFGCPGYMRLAYCVEPEVVDKSLERFEKLAKEYGLI
jgi:aspartate aminotransferase